MPSVEEQLAQWACTVQCSDVPDDAQRTVRRMLQAVVGTGIAGVSEDGIAELRQLLLEAGGTPQASTLVFGDRLPAAAAAQFNATLCRALDFCDAMAPGPHFGAAVFPAVLAAAELRMSQGQLVSGEEFFAALVTGAEIGARFNLSETQYNGFDPTGVAAAFGAAAAAGKMLQLTATQMLHALALAFNRCGGSFQSHVDGSLGVRVLQGWVAQSGVQCAQMAQRGMTGPHRFLAGHYGFAHLYGRDTLDADSVVASLGSTWRLHNMVFKKYPSCGVTQGVTELVVRLLQTPAAQRQRIVGAEVRLPPYAHRLVGHAFRVGHNPRVDAQFSAAYCVASAVLRGGSRIKHFAPDAVADPSVGALAARVAVLVDPAMECRGHTAVDLRLDLVNGESLSAGLDIAPGFPGAELTEVEHTARFLECMSYAPSAPSEAVQGDILTGIQGMAQMVDVGPWIAQLLLYRNASDAMRRR
jgi:2-methylcitrate dehydratase PrpD